MDAGAVRCIHAEGSGCYGHNGADDVALDAALLARAAGRPVRLQWMRDDEFAWEPYGSAMLVQRQGLARRRRPHRRLALRAFAATRIRRGPSAPGTDNNLLASWYLGEPQQARPRHQHSRSPPAAATATPCRSTISPTSGSSII